MHTYTEQESVGEVTTGGGTAKGCSCWTSGTVRLRRPAEEADSSRMAATRGMRRGCAPSSRGASTVVAVGGRVVRVRNPFTGRPDGTRELAGEATRDATREVTRDTAREAGVEAMRRGGMVLRLVENGCGRSKSHIETSWARINTHSAETRARTHAPRGIHKPNTGQGHG